MKMKTLKYRAVLVDEKANQERPVQIFASHREDVDKWAAGVLAAANDGATVNVYATEEQLVALMVKPKPEPPK